MTLLIIALLGLIYQVNNLQEDVLTLKNIAFLQKGVNAVDNHRRIAQKFRNLSSAVFSLRCQNSEKKPKKWWGTGFKVSEDVIISARHIIDKELMPDSKEKNSWPHSCEIYSEGQLVGKFDSEKNPYKNIGDLDMILLKTTFNEAGSKITPLRLKVSHEPYEGEPLLIISHPENFLDDYIISFGYVLNRNANKIQSKDRKKAWDNAVLTDMVAAPGASGSPLLTLSEEVIGIHVGGNEKRKLRSNYQLLFNAGFYLDFQLFKLQATEKETKK